MMERAFPPNLATRISLFARLPEMRSVICRAKPDGRCCPGPALCLSTYGKHCEWQTLRAMPRSGVSRRYAIDAGGRFLSPRYNIFRIPLENDNQSLKGIILLGPRNRRPVLSQDLFFDKICSSPG